MKDFIKNIIKFSAFLIIFYVCFIVLCQMVLPGFLTPNINYKIGSYGHLYSRIKDLKSYENVDVLVLGSSHAYRGIDPRIFKKRGIRIFNLGSSAQTPLQTELLINRYLDKLNPKVVVFEVFPGVFANDGVESSLDLISNDSIDLDIFLLALKQIHIKVYNTLLVSYFKSIFNLNKDFVEKKYQDFDTYIDGGFVEKDESYSEQSRLEPSNQSFLLMKDLQKKAFQRILKNLRNRQIKTVLIQAPVTKEKYSSVLNNKEIDEYFLSNGRYYNFNSLMDLSTTDYFYDSHHLNQKGVEKFSNALIDLLLENGFL